jgi:hypothetical protein
MELSIRALARSLAVSLAPPVRAARRYLGFAPAWQGWGMSTFATPWNPPHGKLGAGFASANTSMLRALEVGDFRLSQFANSSSESVLGQLAWRHYVVYVSAALAGRACRERAGAPVPVVECGVCDGLTAHFAFAALRDQGIAFSARLYDAWAPMQGTLLLPSEKKHDGDYSYLDLAQTRRNLAPWGSSVTLVKGMIPESFGSDATPESIAWMHVDLNSAVATDAVLKQFGRRIIAGGVILFDDYAHPGYEDTKLVVDKFAASLNSPIVCLPTGQGIWFAGA